MLATGDDAVAPKNSHIFDVLVVIPRRQPINRIANIEGKCGIVEAVHPKIVVDVTIDHLGELAFDITSERKSHDCVAPFRILRAVIRIFQSSADVTAETGPTGLADVKEGDGLLPSRVVGLNILGQFFAVFISAVLKPISEVPLALLVAVFHSVVGLFHVVEGLIRVHEGREAAHFLLVVCPSLTTGLDERFRRWTGQGSFGKGLPCQWRTLERTRSVRRSTRDNADATVRTGGDEVQSRAKVQDAKDNSEQEHHKAKDVRAQRIHVDPDFVGIDGHRRGHQTPTDTSALGRYDISRGRMRRGAYSIAKGGRSITMATAVAIGVPRRPILRMRSLVHVCSLQTSKVCPPMLRCFFLL